MKALSLTVGSVLASLTEELAVALGLLLVAAGFWDWWRPGAFLVPGAVLLWLFMPQRERFMRPVPTPARRRKD